jgi:enamine deaminase RidA (YjgF/YER057c/UK114 family)
MSVNLIRRPAGLGEPRGRYSHVSVARGTELVTVAGQFGIDEHGEMTGDKSVTAQTRQAFANIAAALDEVGLSPADVFKTTTFVVDADNIDEFMTARTAVFADMFPSGQYPPNTLLVVARLVEPQFAIEIEASAIRPVSS